MIILSMLFDINKLPVFVYLICLLLFTHYTVSRENDTDVARYSFDVDQPILIIFGRDVAERVCYQTMICYPTSPS